MQGRVHGVAAAKGRPEVAMPPSGAAVQPRPSRAAAQAAGAGAHVRPRQLSPTPGDGPVARTAMERSMAAPIDALSASRTGSLSGADDRLPVAGRRGARAFRAAREASARRARGTAAW